MMIKRSKDITKISLKNIKKANYRLNEILLKIFINTIILRTIYLPLHIFLPLSGFHIFLISLTFISLLCYAKISSELDIDCELAHCQGICLLFSYIELSLIRLSE